MAKGLTMKTKALVMLFVATVALAIILLLVLIPLAHAEACPGASGCEPHADWYRSQGPAERQAFAAPELDPGAGVVSVLLLVGALIVVRGRRK